MNLEELPGTNAVTTPVKDIAGDHSGAVSLFQKRQNLQTFGGMVNTLW